MQLECTEKTSETRSVELCKFKNEQKNPVPRC